MKGSTIPQAQRLERVREVVDAVAQGARAAKDVTAVTSVTPRHVGYALQAAALLGLLAQDGEAWQVTPRGAALLATAPKSPDERELLRDAVASNATLAAVAPDLLTSDPPDRESITARIVAATGLGRATAERRAEVLLSWRRQLAAPQLSLFETTSMDGLSPATADASSVSGHLPAPSRLPGPLDRSLTNTDPSASCSLVQHLGAAATMTGHDEWTRLKFSERFFESTGSAFQDFFSVLMEAAYPGDFQPVRAAGPTGDLKCDGYILSTGELFQVYAPRNVEMRGDVMVRKIVDDFNGALTHWGGRMRSWIFVHNDWDGQRAERVQALADLESAHPNIAIRGWTRSDLLAVALRLDGPGRIKLFGREPQPHEFARPGFDKLEPLLDHIAARSRADFGDRAIDAIRVDKLDFNALSFHVGEALIRGRRGEPVVERFVAGRRDPTYGESLATAFRGQYRMLMDSGYEPDAIFHQLTRWVGGDYRRNEAFQTAIYATLSYFFERCDIFEEPPP